MSPLPEILFDVARNPFLAGAFLDVLSVVPPLIVARSLADVLTPAFDLVGLPIGLGAISGIITGRTSRSKWFTVRHFPEWMPPVPCLRATDHVSTSREPTTRGLWPSLDHPLRIYGICLSFGRKII